MDKVVGEAVQPGSCSGVKNLQDVQARCRNIFGAAFGIDLSIGSASQSILTASIYRVEEIDELMSPKEATLMDLRNELPVIVDIDDDDLDLMKREDIAAGSIVLATLSSITDGLGMSSAWRFNKSIRILKVR